MVQTSVTKLLVAIAMFEKSPKMITISHIIWPIYDMGHMGKDPHFQIILIKRLFRFQYAITTVVVSFYQKDC